MDQLHDYLYWATFEVRTDNNPLTCVTKSAKLDATGHRWLLALSTYDFSLKYGPGRRSMNADALLQHAHICLSPEDEWQEIPAPGVLAICQVVATQRAGCLSFPYVADQVCSYESAVPKAYCPVPAVASDQLPTFSSGKLQEAQKGDPVMREV